MRLASLVHHLPVVWALSIGPSTSDLPGHHHLAKRVISPYDDRCFLPLVACLDDRGCQSQHSNRTMFSAKGRPALYENVITHAEGFSNDNGGFCDVIVQHPGNSIDFCKTKLAILSKQIAGLSFLNYCYNPNSGAYIHCDYLCDVNESAQCNHHKTYHFDCVDFDVGPKNNGPLGWKCPGTAKFVPPGAQVPHLRTPAPADKPSTKPPAPTKPHPPK